jgi:hypothetical protein
MHETQSRVDVYKRGQGAVRREFTRIIVRLGILLGALVTLAGCARDGELLVSWIPPIHNSDGTPLTDLTSYQIYYNTAGSPCPGAQSIKVDAAVPARNPDGRVAVRLTNMVVGQVYHVALTAINSHGVASACSDTARAAAHLPDKK